MCVCACVCVRVCLCLSVSVSVSVSVCMCLLMLLMADHAWKCADDRTLCCKAANGKAAYAQLHTPKASY